MEKIPLEEMIELLCGLKDQWIYVKLIDGDVGDSVGFYSKFRVKDIVIQKDFIKLVGYEDKDNLYISMKGICQTEVTHNNEEMLIKVHNDCGCKDINIIKYQPRAEQRIQEILTTNNHLVITEGKTDWQILKKALEVFQNNGEYNNLNLTFFECDVMGDRTAEKICQYNALFANDKLRIFIFDADNKGIIKDYDNKRFKFHGNNVYSMILPVPEFRKDTPRISIENYFTDKEIKTIDKEGRRLYLAGEFDCESGAHKELDGIYSPIGKDKYHVNLVLGENVFRIDEPVANKSDIMPCKTKVNIALPKSKFAKYICEEVDRFADISFENFSLIFDVFQEIFIDYYARSDKGKEISKDVYLQKDKNGLQVLSIHISMQREKAQAIKNSMVFSSMALKEDDMLVIDIVADRMEEHLRIPIMITEELLGFIRAKYDNNFNRMELHIMDEDNKEYVSHKEIFSDDLSGIILAKPFL